MVHRAVAMVPACDGPGIALTRSVTPPPPALLPLPVYEPAASVVPMMAPSVGAHRHRRSEADAGLAQTLWRVKAQVEERASQSHPERLASWETRFNEHG